jgi:hypothetical protein
MQPQKKKILIVTAVSLGIISMSFLIPIFIVPAAIGVSSASSCAIATDCAQDTYSKCGAYQSGQSSSFGDSLDRGMKGMLCMIGLDSGKPQAILWAQTETEAITLNKIPVI